MEIEIYADKCIGCGKCVENCPSGVLSITNDGSGIFVSVLPIRTFVSDVKDVQDFVQMMPSRSRRATRENIIGLPSNQDFGLFLPFF